MGKKKRSQIADKPPLSSHPLFPAIVALWFGALFGFGSLAIRKSLIESIVLKAQIDTIFESAAPPLGITTRIVLALIMAVIGAVIGGLLARRLARPKAKKHVIRRRNAGHGPVRTVTSDADQQLGPVSFGKNAARTAEVEAAEAPVRRRGLTATNQYDREDDFHFANNSAPLPGGVPEIFDVKASDVASWVQPDPIEDPVDFKASALDLTDFEAPVPAAINGFDNGFDLDRAEFTAELPASDFAATGFSNVPETLVPELSVFDPLPDAQPESLSLAAPAIPVAYEPEPESRHFAAPEPASEAFAAPSIPVAYEPEQVEAQSPFSKPNGFYSDEVSFARKPLTEEAAAPEAEMAVNFNQPDQANIQPLVAEPAIPEAYFAVAPQEPAEFRAQAESPVAQPLGLAASDPMPRVEPMETQLQPDMTAQPLAAANLDDLSPEELLQRLAMSIRNRQAPPVAIAAQTVVTPADPALQTPVQAAPSVPAASFDAPSSGRLTIPAALKPINFSEYEDDDELDSFLPQRSILMPKSAAPIPQPAPEPIAAPASIAQPITAGFGAMAMAPAAADPVEEVAEDEYSSLLDISKPSQTRQNFVRIDEPEIAEGDIETVVVFPGQGMHNGNRFAPPAASSDPVPQAFVVPSAPQPQAAVPSARNFAEPPEFPQQAQAQSQQSSFPAGPTAIDPSETERALRSALANLQRMTGAA